MRRFYTVATATAAILFLMARPVTAQNLLTNGSFETGTFSGWTQGGNSGFDGVFCPGGAPDGNCQAFFGAIGSNSTLSQTVNTQLGALYNLSFWFDPDGNTPSFFDVSWGGTSLFSVTNSADDPYTLKTFQDLVGQAGSTTLTFTFRDDPGFQFLDDVRVTSVTPEPATMSLMATGLVGIVGAGLRRRKRA